MSLGPTVPAFGPTPNKLMVLGEAPGEEEEKALRPFVGPSGQELRRMLSLVGVSLDDTFRTNVFSRRPPQNDVALGYGVPRGDPAGCTRLGPLTSNPASFLHNDHLPELDRLAAEIARCRPNVILALGNTAAWALGLGLGISSLRGTVHLHTPRAARCTESHPHLPPRRASSANGPSAPSRSATCRRPSMKVGLPRNALR